MTARELTHAARILASQRQRRHLVRWLQSRRPTFLLDAPSPWLTFDAIDRIRARMRDGMRIFEYGSGGSTLFWAQWDVALCSVEHDREWYEVVKGKLQPGKVDYRLVPPEPFSLENLQADYADPHAYVANDERSRGMTFRRYAAQIDEFPDGHFDLVLVDGRARPSCIAHAVPKVKQGGLLVLDNADRAYYTSRVGESLRAFTREAYVGVAPQITQMSQTDVYVRL